MEVIPHQGIGALWFGMRREDVEAELGAPERSEHETWDDGTDSETWHYRLSRLELGFDSICDYRLCRITSYHPHTIIRGFNPIGLAQGFLLQRYPHLKLRADGGEIGSNYVDEILDLSFWVERDGVKQVTAYPEIDIRTGDYVWPELFQAQDD